MDEWGKDGGRWGWRWDREQITQTLYTVLGGWVLLWENLEALCRAVAELVCLWSGSSQPPFGGWAAGAGVELGAPRGGCCQVLSGRWWCGWERGKAPVCSDGGAHRLCREMEGRVRKKEESGKPRSSPGTGFHLWRQGRLWGETSWEPFLVWGLLSTSSRSFLLMPGLAYRFLFFFLLAAPHSMQDLSSLTRNEPVHPAVDAWSANNRTVRDFLFFFFKFYTFLKAAFHLQLLQNISFITHVVQYIHEPILAYIICCLLQLGLPWWLRQ